MRCMQELGLFLLNPCLQPHTQSVLPAWGVERKTGALLPHRYVVPILSSSPRTKGTFWRERPFTCEYTPSLLCSPALSNRTGSGVSLCPPSCPHSAPPALIFFPIPALMKAEEGAEASGRLWEPQLQAIDPSIQVCQGSLSLCMGQHSSVLVPGLKVCSGCWGQQDLHCCWVSVQGLCN